MDQLVSMNGEETIEGVVDFDNLEFKLLDDGLGFHQEKSTETIQEKKQPVVSKKREVQSKLLPLSKDMDHKLPVLSVDLTAKESEIGTILRENSKTEKPAISSSNIEKSEEFIVASTEKRAAAFVIDLTIICLFPTVLFAIFSFISQQILGTPLDILISKSLAPYFATLCFFIGVLYFSLLDRSSTIGKGWLGLSVQSAVGEKLTFSSILLRTVLTFSSFLAIGLPLVLDLPGRLSETIVTEVK